MSGGGTKAVLTGGCMCGSVRFEISEPLVFAAYCHCRGCQRRTGAAVGAGARIVPGSLTVVAGSELISEWAPEGGRNVKRFCSHCGGTLYAQSPVDGAINIRLGTLDADPGIRPSFRQFVSSACSWEEIPDDGLPRYDEANPAITAR